MYYSIMHYLSRGMLNNFYHVHTTVVPVKSDSDVMVCLLVRRDLESTDHLFINPIQDRINTQAIFRFELAQVKRTRYSVVLSNCKQNVRHCHSRLARQYEIRGPMMNVYNSSVFCS